MTASDNRSHEEDSTVTPVAPNPHSPYANANPNARHLIPSLLGALPAPGVLAVAACGRMAVTPEGTLTDATDALAAGRFGELPPGLCADCVGVASGESNPVRALVPMVECEECGGLSSEGQWCALCRQDLHEKWWPTREQVTDRCWIIRREGEDDESANERHFTKAEARREAEHLIDDGETVTVEQLDQPCITLTCQGCDYVIDEDADGVIHFRDVKEAHAYVVGSYGGEGVVFAGDLLVRCGADCTAEDADARDPADVLKGIGWIREDGLDA